MSNIFPDRSEQYLEKPLPSSEESERVILGAILLDNELIHEASAYLKPETFYSPLNRRVFAAMLHIAYADQNVKGIDPIQIGEILKREGSLESIGGTTTITNLTFGLPHFSDISEYVQLVRGKGAIRDRIRLCNSITSELLAEEDDPDATLQRADMSWQDHVDKTGRIIDAKASDMTESLVEWNRRVEQWKSGKSSSLPSPSPMLNRLLAERGFGIGDLSLLAARPSDGKTTFGVQTALGIARHYAPSLIITLEMPTSKIMQKILAGEAQVPNYRINESLYTSEYEKDREWVGRINAAQQRIKDIPLFIDDQSMSLSSILATCHEYVVKRGVKFIFVDYGQIVRNDLANKKMGMTRDRELGEIADHLKWFAKKETKTKPAVHVMLAVQLKRLKATPTLEDLRESGSFEQTADLVLAPYGEKPKEETIIREMRILCLKQRLGRMGWYLPISFNGDWQRFYDRQMMDDNRNAPGSIAEPELFAPTPAAPILPPSNDDPEF